MFSELEAELNEIINPITDTFAQSVSAFVNDFKPAEKVPEKQFSTQKLEPKSTKPPTTSTTTTTISDDLVASDLESE